MTDNLLDKTEFTEMEVSEGMNQTATGEKRVTISGLGDVILKYPTRKDEMDADNERSKAYTRFLLDDTLRTEDELKKIAENRGMWTQADEDKITEMQEKIAKIQVEVLTSKKGNAQKKKRKELIDARKEFMDLIIKKNSIFSHSVESKATNVWWQFLVFRCTFKENGERMWTDYNKFLDESSSSRSIEIIAEYIAFYNGMGDNFFDLLQEGETEQPESGETDGV